MPAEYREWLFNFLSSGPRPLEAIRKAADAEGLKGSLEEALVALRAEMMPPWPSYGGYRWMPAECREWRVGLPAGTFKH